MLVRIPSPTVGQPSEVFTIDFREVAPALANATMFKNSPSLSKYGGLSVAVPGEVLGLEEAHRRWGKVSWQRLIQPSIDLAQGWEVDRELGKRIPVSSQYFFFIRKYGALISVCHSSGTQNSCLIILTSKKYSLLVVFSCAKAKPFGEQTLHEPFKRLQKKGQAPFTR